METLCGDLTRLLSREIVFRNIRRLRIRFVSGSLPFVRGYRGFNFSISTLVPRGGGDKPILAAYVIGVVLFLLFIIAVAVLIRKKTSKRSRRRPRPSSTTWQGAAPTPGMSLHAERLAHISLKIYLFLPFRTNNLIADIKRGSLRKESDNQNHDANEGEERNPENIYNDDDDCYTISYSVPVRKGRNLPSLPMPESEKKHNVKEEEKGSSCTEEQEPMQCWVTVFGFEPSHAVQVISLMQPSRGSILQQRTGYLNWMHIQYSSRLQAQQARQNGPKDACRPGRMVQMTLRG